MSTPRTAAKTSKIIGFWSCATVPASFAEELEKENRELRTALKELRRWVADGDCSDDAGIWPGFATTAYRDAVRQADDALSNAEVSHE